MINTSVKRGSVVKLLLACALMVLGVMGLAYGGISFTHEKKDVDRGSDSRVAGGGSFQRVLNGPASRRSALEPRRSLSRD
jgi:hypothetical protein